MADQLDNARLNAELQRLLTGDDGKPDLTTALKRWRDAGEYEIVPNYMEGNETLIVVVGDDSRFIDSIPWQGAGPGNEWEIVWHNREGKVWQSALEAHVANYREPAPDYDWRELLLVTLPKAGKSMDVESHSDEMYVQRAEIKSHPAWRVFDHDDPQLALKVKAWCVEVLREHTQGEGTCSTPKP